MFKLIKNINIIFLFQPIINKNDKNKFYISDIRVYKMCYFLCKNIKIEI